MSKTPETPRKTFVHFDRKTNWPNSWPKIVLLGDSLMEYSFDREGGFGSLLASRFRRQADIINRGFSGYNSTLLARALPSIFNESFLKSVACLVLCIGVNDSFDQVTEHGYNPHVSIQEYAKNLKEIIEWLQEKGLDKYKVIMLTPPAIDEEKWKSFNGQDNLPTYKTSEQTLRYVDAMKKTGSDLDILTLDAFSLTSEERHKKLAFNDGLHFSSYGADLIYDLLKNFVKYRVDKFRYPHLAHQTPQHCPFDRSAEVRTVAMDADNNLPNYNEINFNELDRFVDYFNTNHP